MDLEVHFQDRLCWVVWRNLTFVEVMIILLLLWWVLGHRFFVVWIVERLITLRLGQHLRDELIFQFLAVLHHVAKLSGGWKRKITISLRLLFSLHNFGTTCLIYLRCTVWFVVDLKSGLVWWCLVPISWNFPEQIFDAFEVLLELFIIVGLVTIVSSVLLWLFDSGFRLVVGSPESQDTAAHRPVALYGRVFGHLNTTTVFFNVELLINYLGKFLARLPVAFLIDTILLTQGDFLLHKGY